MTEEDYNVDFERNRAWGVPSDGLEALDLALDDEVLERGHFFTEEDLSKPDYQIPEDELELLPCDDFEDYVEEMYDNEDIEELVVPELEYEEMPAKVFRNLSAMTGFSGMIFSGAGDHVIEGIAPIFQGDKFVLFSMRDSKKKQFYEWRQGSVRMSDERFVSNGVDIKGKKFYYDRADYYHPLHELFEIVALSDLIGILVRVNGRTYKLLKINYLNLRYVLGSMVSKEGDIVFSSKQMNGPITCNEGDCYKVSMSCKLIGSARNVDRMRDIKTKKALPTLANLYYMMKYYRGHFFVKPSVYPGNCDRNVPFYARAAYIYNTYGWVIEKDCNVVYSPSFGDFLIDLKENKYISQVIRVMKQRGARIDFDALRVWIECACVVMKQGLIMKFKSRNTDTPDFRYPIKLAHMGTLVNDRCELPKIGEELAEVLSETDPEKRVLEVGDLIHAVIKCVSNVGYFNTMAYVGTLDDLQDHRDKFRKRIEEMGTLNRNARKDRTYYSTIAACNFGSCGYVAEQNEYAVAWLKKHDYYGIYMSLTPMWNLIKEGAIAAEFESAFPQLFDLNDDERFGFAMKVMSTIGPAQYAVLHFLLTNYDEYWRVSFGYRKNAQLFQRIVRYVEDYAKRSSINEVD